MYIYQFTDRDISFVRHTAGFIMISRVSTRLSRCIAGAGILLRLRRRRLVCCRLVCGRIRLLLRLRCLPVLCRFRSRCRDILRSLYCICLILSLLRRNAVIQNIQIEGTPKNLRDHTHVSFLKIIPAKPLRQVLTGHLLPGTPFDLLSKFLDRHILTAQNNLDLFSKR